MEWQAARVYTRSVPDDSARWPFRGIVHSAVGMCAFWLLYSGQHCCFHLDVLVGLSFIVSFIFISFMANEIESLFIDLLAVSLFVTLAIWGFCPFFCQVISY